MRIAQMLAGISLAEADVLRKAVGKKDAELIRAELGKFVEKSVARGHDRDDHRGDRGADRDVRPLRLQQVARRRVLDHLVPYGVAQGALPRRFHGGAAVVADRRHRQRRQVHQRSARARPRDPAARRQRVGLQVHRRSATRKSASDSAAFAMSARTAIDSILAAREKGAPLHIASSILRRASIFACATSAFSRR